MSMGLAGRPFLVVGPSGGNCFCPCSCVAAHTRVLLEDGREKTLTTIALGDAVFSPFSSAANEVSRKLSTPVQNYPAYRLAFSDGTNLTVSHNHTFATPDLKILQASKARVGDWVATAEGAPVRIIAVLPQAPYTGAMQNLVVNAASPSAFEHLISTEGILSGDFLLQAYSDTVDAAVDLRMDDVPVYDLR